jgi:hypothetical protein
MHVAPPKQSKTRKLGYNGTSQLKIGSVSEIENVQLNRLNEGYNTKIGLPIFAI